MIYRDPSGFVNAAISSKQDFPAPMLSSWSGSTKGVSDTTSMKDGSMTSKMPLWASPAVQELETKGYDNDIFN